MDRSVQINKLVLGISIAGQPGSIQEIAGLGSGSIADLGKSGIQITLQRKEISNSHKFESLISFTEVLVGGRQFRTN